MTKLEGFSEKSDLLGWLPGTMAQILNVLLQLLKIFRLGDFGDLAFLLRFVDFDAELLNLLVQTPHALFHLDRIRNREGGLRGAMA